MMIELISVVRGGRAGAIDDFSGLDLRLQPGKPDEHRRGNFLHLLGADLAERDAISIQCHQATATPAGAEQSGFNPVGVP
jgi:hypothetical protein